MSIRCTCPSGDGSLIHPCPFPHPGDPTMHPITITPDELRKVLQALQTRINTLRMYAAAQNTNRSDDFRESTDLMKLHDTLKLRATNQEKHE